MLSLRCKSKKHRFPLRRNRSMPWDRPAARRRRNFTGVVQ